MTFSRMLVPLLALCALTACGASEADPDEAAGPTSGGESSSGPDVTILQRSGENQSLLNNKPLRITLEKGQVKARVVTDGLRGCYGTYRDEKGSFEFVDDGAMEAYGRSNGGKWTKLAAADHPTYDYCLTPVLLQRQCLALGGISQKSVRKLEWAETHRDGRKHWVATMEASEWAGTFVFDEFTEGDQNYHPLVGRPLRVGSPTTPNSLGRELVWRRSSPLPVPKSLGSRAATAA